jgi:hypothetical protein
MHTDIYRRGQALYDLLIECRNVLPPAPPGKKVDMWTQRCLKAAGKSRILRIWTLSVDDDMLPFFP